MTALPCALPQFVADKMAYPLSMNPKVVIACIGEYICVLCYKYVLYCLCYTVCAILFVLQFVADKVAYALSMNLKVIACIGESLEQREAGETMKVVAAQLQAIKGAWGRQGCPGRGGEVLKCHSVNQTLSSLGGLGCLRPPVLWAGQGHQC